MRRAFRVGSYADEVWIARSFDAAIPQGARPIDPEDAERSVARWFPDTGASLHALAEIAGAIGHAPGFRPDLEGARSRAAVKAALRAGVLEAFRMPEKLSGGAARKGPEKPREPEQPREQKTFVAIQLVDDSQPPRPVPFKRYRIELPDHSSREGMLDANGRARVDGIDPGTCKVSFPDFDAPDWRAA